MTGLSLTPLETLPVFDEALRTKLANYWITSVEEFHGVVRSANRKHGSGRKALAVTLGIDEARVALLADAARNALPMDTPFDLTVEMEFGSGLLFDESEAFDEGSFAAVTIDLPDHVDPLTSLKGIPGAQQQGRRNTCVAFTLAAMVQILSGDPTDLSEQFLYYLCKEQDGLGDVGTDPNLALQLLQEKGICTETTWKYVPEPSATQPGGPTPPAIAYDEAKRRRITGFTRLPTGSLGVTQIQAQLAQNKPVLIGMPIYEHWSSSTQGNLLGRLRAPLDGENLLGGHAMCVVGYRTDASAPGGGYFIVRNSWGSDWAKDNLDGPGYCHMPYLLVSKYNKVAYVVEGVTIAQAVQPTAPAAIAKPVAAGKVQRNARPAARLGSAGVAGDNLMAIYADLLTLKDQVADLTERLQMILGVSPPIDVEPEEVESLVQPVEPAAPPANVVATPAPTPEIVPYTAPLVFISTGASEPSEDISPNGIDGVSGELLLKIDSASAARLARGQTPESAEMRQLYRDKEADELAKQKAKQEQAEDPSNFLTVGDVDPNKIEEARWAVVVSAAESVDVLKALWPLIDHRMRQMGFAKRDFDFVSGDTNCGVWYNRHTEGGTKTLANAWLSVPPVLILQPGESVNKWLARHGTSQAPVDPTKGVPFYLLLLGRPGPLDASDQAYIPLHFQYELDIFWGVGRLIFSDQHGRHRLDDYKAYANQVVNWEQRVADSDKYLNKTFGFFGTRHEDDNSTIRSADKLVAPLIDWSTNSKYAKALGFGRTTYLNKDATRDNLGRLLSSRPALLFTASHGVGLPLSDPARLVLNQGSLVTADFTFGSIKRDHWLSGEDLDALNPNLEGMIACLFACYGVGCPQKDEFIFDDKKRHQQIAPFPFVAQLPQRMLARGALAVLGHVERAWTYSFSSTEGADAQIQPFQDVFSRLLNAWSVGSATDQFNVIQGARSLTLTQALEEQKYGDGGAAITDVQISKLWMARNDARNYALLGDPAVKLGT
ncbi:MAG: peptidase C1 [Oscillochloris sp.]|nr:peptidase C1 [Oscillochloris sp.]